MGQARRSKRQQENGQRTKRIRRSVASKSSLCSDGLELKKKFMELGVAPDDTSTGRIHFSSFDADKSHLDGRGKEKVVYRFCSVSKESNDLIYQHCDAQTGATGAGVYVRLREEEGKWRRRVIGCTRGISGWRAVMESARNLMWQ
ncbi:hypothetical protein WMY93_015541 [Mugilogobius chulae]|uniref:Uncharacterized protein n=1 Tax=Mugilogobius chulae TaxID=88201 RepID=A0AAW0P0J3_9GOBI